MGNPLFFVAIIPAREIADEITEMKMLIADKFDSRRALNSPPHITLIPPFRLTASELKSLTRRLNQISKNFNKFYLNLNGFGHFSNRVIYVNIDQSPDLKAMYDTLGNELNDDLSAFSSKSFHPHMTIAFRDLSPDNFIKAWNHFHIINYIRVFEVYQLSLLKHNGKYWELIKQIPFN